MLFNSLFMENQFRERFPFELHESPDRGNEPAAPFAEPWHNVGEFALLEYTDGREVRLMLPYATYGSPRNYVESAVAREAVMRVRASMANTERSASIPTKEVHTIRWFYLYAPNADYGAHPVERAVTPSKDDASGLSSNVKKVQEVIITLAAMVDDLPSAAQVRAKTTIQRARELANLLRGY